ncbi:hypothetical protein GCM10010259_10720 [Streptomyces daghestanicus]|uniref:Tc1-like transposase DDE domain-containing protein n=1 Tax=Streptomyces daghestanicus TaxID=66885 RepID=A0ABQ3Q252_9ACTN|nr:hypothetical protein GCM10010259_10720 [Streptomyces daghestanicus]GHI31372.1 hypothetical protein Sdagh_31020 [Streptomyces daghestanicus]
MQVLPYSRRLRAGPPHAPAAGALPLRTTSAADIAPGGDEGAVDQDGLPTLPGGLLARAGPVRRAVRSPRPASAGRWTRSQSAISRIRRAFALAPHRSQTFKLSTDPLYIDKVRDVVGLCLDPPEKALVLCVDEKSQIQALDRSQPVLPMMPGVPERRSHDYVRAGTTTLFAALEAATGKVIGSLHRRHRAAEFKKFLAELDKEVPAGLQVHLILDNYATHKTPDIKKWLPAHSRVPPALHAHQRVLAEPGRAMVRRTDPEETQARGPPLRPGRGRGSDRHIGARRRLRPCDHVRPRLARGDSAPPGEDTRAEVGRPLHARPRGLHAKPGRGRDARPVRRRLVPDLTIRAPIDLQGQESNRRRHVTNA